MLLWPPGIDMQPAHILPALEELVVTYPSSQDQLYSCLSSCMRSLSIECFDMSTSRVCPTTWYEMELLISGTRPKRQTPIPCASELLAILARCRTPRIHTLRIEYYADHAEDELLSHIVAAFPGLEFLRLCRYRAEGDEEPQGACASVCCMRSLLMRNGLLPCVAEDCTSPSTTCRAENTPGPSRCCARPLSSRRPIWQRVLSTAENRPLQGRTSPSS